MRLFFPTLVGVSLLLLMTEPSISLHPLHHLSPNLELSCLSQPLSPMSSLVFPYLCSLLQSYPYSSSPNQSPPSSTHAPFHLSLLHLITSLIFSMPILSLSSAFVFFSLSDTPHIHLTTTTTTIYFNKVVFPSLLGLTSSMAFPQHSPPS